MRNSLKLNGYTDRFIECEPKRNATLLADSSSQRATVILPYVQGVSDQIRRTLRAYNIGTILRPQQTLASVFKKPKDRLEEKRIPGIVYKVKCRDCQFTYVGESKRSWNSRATEHDPARAASRESAISNHAHTTTHDIHPRYATILERHERNYDRRLFLESLHSTIDKNCINEYKPFPNSYRPLLKLLRNWLIVV